MPLLLAVWAFLTLSPGGLARALPASGAVAIPPGTPTLGPRDAPVTVFEFEDFQCPFCRREEGVVEQLLSEFPGKIRFVHKDLPLDIHVRAFAAAGAARCAGEQGRFWEYRHVLFASGDLTDDGLQEAAAVLRLGLSAFQACFGSHRYDAALKRSMHEAASLGIRTTPSFVVNGRLLEGALPLRTLREAVALGLPPPIR